MSNSTCAECGVQPIVQKKTGTRRLYCSPRCRRSALYRRNAKKDLASRKTRRHASRLPKACDVCSEIFTPTTSVQIFCSRKCNHRRHRADAQRLRFLRYDSEAERIDRELIGERDGWICGICNEPVDPLLNWPESNSQSLDHVIPLSKGGLHRTTNVRISHLGCNVKRGNRD